MNTQSRPNNHESEVRVFNGWAMLAVNIALLAGGIGLMILSLVRAAQQEQPPNWYQFVGSILIIITSFVWMRGFFTLQPNEARVLILFGAYKGTVRTGGFHWGNPFYSSGPGVPMSFRFQPQGETPAAASKSGAAAAMHKTMSRYKISLRSRNHNGDKLKVNDKRGNPIEIAAVVVWRVQDTAQAIFDVEDYENYVRIQSESAVRHLASAYAYDHGEENETTLRSGVEEVSLALRKELQERLEKAGVLVEEARLTHLAYAPEIAQAMLRRQQAEAVIAARQKIVHGAVSMVDMALKELAEKHVVQLDDERKAAMVSNLMVVLCGESEVHPVVNTGTLYTG
jgi:regulator of protease activity HflC (stomatin/prohibitin superfamily)